MQEIVTAVRRLQWHSRSEGEAFADNGVQLVVNSVLVFPQQFYHWVVGPAEDK